MSNVKITQLPIAIAVDGTEYVEIAQNTGAPTGYISRRAKTSLLLAGVTTSLAARLALSISVKDYGALGDGVTDDTAAIQAAIYAAFGTSINPNGANYSLNRPLYFPPGNYKTTSVLAIPPVQGAVIYGAGQFTTTITNNTNSGIFSTNGFDYSTVSDMQLTTNSTTCVVFDFNHDGINHNGINSAFFCNFTNLFITGGSIGMQVGAGGTTCSDSIWTNCTFQAASVAGIKFCNFNSLDHVIINCAFAGNPIGIWVFQGSVATVISSGFAGSTSWDIKIDNSGGGGTVVSGVRTESLNFIRCVNEPIVVQGCGQSNNAAGSFLDSGGCQALVSACTSGNGKINCDGNITINNFQTGRTDGSWLSFAANTMISMSGVRTGFGNLFDANTTFSMLPGPAPFVGTRGFIKDATVSTFGTSITVGGGTNKVPIWSNGTNWLVG